jgi:acyl-coenzyme A thioesterase PaaI-like protein
VIQWLAALVGKGQANTTVEMKINYVRCTTTKMDPDRSIGNRIHGGRSIGAAEPRLEDKAGKLSAYAMETSPILQNDGDNQENGVGPG